jgi:hypothetical protein
MRYSYSAQVRHWANAIRSHAEASVACEVLRTIKTEISFPVTRLDYSEGDGMLCFRPYFDILHNQDGRCQHYDLVATDTTENFLLLISVSSWADSRSIEVHRRNKLLENFVGPYRKSNPEPSLRTIKTIAKNTIFTTIVLMSLVCLLDVKCKC